MHTVQFNFCPQCGAKLESKFEYCSACGLKLSDVSEVKQPNKNHFLDLKNLGIKGLFAVIALSVLLGLGANKIQTNLAGVKPTENFKSSGQDIDPSDRSEITNDPVLKKLQENAQANQNDLKAWREFGEALMARLRETNTPSNALIFETIDVLRQMLVIDQNDSFALVGMADLSLNAKVFPKAVEYYKRYLVIKPHDSEVRARLGSALTFTGEYEESIKELNSVIKKEPKNFQALAYLSITYSEMGNHTEALKVGEKALNAAPTNEARERFQSFLESIKNKKNAAANPQGNENIKGIPAIEAGIKNNPVAGPKFVKAEQDGNTLNLYFKDFPMQAMPPFAKEKFFATIKKLVKENSEAKEVVFIDQATGQEMDKISLK